MISFIIIGKNEGVKIKNALNSVFESIEYTGLAVSAVIYVDSNSSDNSMEFAREFPSVKILLVTGQVNAAIARNEGANYAKGEILFFIDGDMEIRSGFLKEALNDNMELEYPFLSGDFVSIDKSYEGNGKEILYHNLKKDTYQNTTGGIFLIERKLWQKVGGMKPKMRRSQDIDLGLRLTKMGFPLLRKKKVIADHYTTFYHSDNRIWKDLLKGNQLFQRSVLYRDHIANRAIYKFLSKEVSLFGLILVVVLSLIGFSWLILLVYPLLIFLKLILKRKTRSIREWIKFFIFFISLDLMVLFGIFFFWPSNIKQYKVELIESQYE